MIDFPNSPSVGQIFTAAGASWRYDGVKWVAYGGGSSGNVGRNLLHNGSMAINQRGSGPFASNAYTLDRWLSSGSSDTVSIIRSSISDSDRAGIGDEAATYCLQNNFTGNAAAGAYNNISQSIEDIRRLAGKTVTISFWANAGTALKLGINLLQNFGTGGSPSGGVWALATGASVSIPGPAWARYTATVAVPGITGKTLGTNNNHYTSLNLFYSSGTNTNAIAGNIGVQSGLINIWGVQLEIGSTATPLEKLDPRMDLANCQRFYQGGSVAIGAYSLAGTGISVSQFFAAMRATPTIVLYNQAYGNASGAITDNISPNGLRFKVIVTGTGAAEASATFTASADL